MLHQQSIPDFSLNWFGRPSIRVVSSVVELNKLRSPLPSCWYTVDAPSVGQRYTSLLSWNQRSTRLIVQLCGALFHWRMCDKNSFHFFNLFKGIAESEIVLSTTLHPSSPRTLMFFRVVFSPFLLNYFVEMIMLYARDGTDICSDGKPFDL